MAVILVHQGPTLSQEGYEEAIRRLTRGKDRTESPSDWPVEGLLVHAAGQSEDGFRIVDVWESEDAFAALARPLCPFSKTWVLATCRRCIPRIRSSRPDVANAVALGALRAGEGNRTPVTSLGS